jgi:pilus assembly protein Flp/PilA
MKAMASLLRRFRRDESGTTAIEYGFIATFIALAIITSVQLVGSTLITEFYDQMVAAFN